MYALNPDSTKKWEFATGNFVTSSPCIGADGTLYIGSFDSKVYAITTAPPGDVNGNGKVDLADVIIALQVVAGLNPPKVYVETRAVQFSG